MNTEKHWNKVYAKNPAGKLGWYTAHLETSLSWITELMTDRSCRLIDVGGGVSTLVDDLLAEGYENISVADISSIALEISRNRVAGKASRVRWITADITSSDLHGLQFDLWHDRAVFHFLTSARDRDRYLETLKRTVVPGGYVIFGTFSPETPPRCSGLPVRPYSCDLLAETLGPSFEIVRSHTEPHIMPNGDRQIYLYTCARKIT